MEGTYGVGRHCKHWNGDFVVFHGLDLDDLALDVDVGVGDDVDDKMVF